MRLPALLLIPIVLTACEIPPKFVESSDIDDAMARQAYKTVCVGLSMKDEKTRRYAASKMKEITEPISVTCVCENISDEKKGWDSAVAAGIKGTDRDDLAGCLANLVKDPTLKNRTEAIVALGYMPARVARDTLAGVASETGGDPEARSAAIGSVGGDPTYTDQIVDLLKGEKDNVVRAAAAKALRGNKDEAVLAAMRTAASSDEDGAVRGEALLGLKQAGVEGADELLCTAMLEDPSPEVRRRAVMSFKGTKRADAIACLRKRALTEEPDPGVRAALLKVVKSSPKKAAKKILCDAIPFWARTYMQEELPPKVPSADIIKAQNDRDWENSYDCIGKAYRSSSGYSCFARLYVGFWYREVGGSSHLPNCPGYENEQIAGK
jgi:HEAT repeat protein